MALLTKSALLSKARDTSHYTTESLVREFSANALANEKRAADTSYTGRYDIFLSHSSEDAIYIKALRDLLTEAGFSVYVDWINDPLLDRANVSKATAQTLRLRMQSCGSLLYATSRAAEASVWMPWELGYMDAHTDSRVAVIPVVNDNQADTIFVGREYLGLYPYLDKTGNSFWMHESAHSFIPFRNWLNGSNPPS
jgi:hypothetical protein